VEVTERNGKSELRSWSEAFRLKEEDLLSTDPAVSTPARRVLLQKLVDLQGSTLAAHLPLLSEFRQAYLSAVKALADRGQQIVVASGDSGDAIGRLNREPGGGLRFPKDFGKTVLGFPGAVIVGVGSATEHRCLLDPLNPDTAGTTIFADGAIPDGNLPEPVQPLARATSAAARVAAVLWKIRRDHPGIAIDEATRTLTSGTYAERATVERGHPVFVLAVPLPAT
jgi:hypothetical protein